MKGAFCKENTNCAQAQVWRLSVLCGCRGTGRRYNLNRSRHDLPLLITTCQSGEVNPEMKLCELLV